MYVRMYICMYVCTQTHMWCIFSLPMFIPLNMGQQTSSTNRNVLTAYIRYLAVTTPVHEEG